MEPAIYNITDLRAEIDRLKGLKTEQEAAIVSHFNSPAAIFHTVTSMFKGSSASDQKDGLFGNGQDFVSLISRVVLPFVLNKTIFRGSNFIIKAVVGLLSQKASGFINEKTVVTAWDKIRSVIPSILHRNKNAKKQHVDYGIPPDSETY